jgi:hypothetical protein
MINTSVDNYSVDVQNCFIVSADGTMVKVIKNNILSVNIVEDIFTPFIMCDIAIIDYNQLSETFPLVGEEYFIINFSKNSDNGQESKQTSYTFLIHKQSQIGIGENNRFQGYVLHGISYARVADAATYFSQSYHQKYSTIAESIFNQYFSGIGKNIIVEPTKGVQKYVVPNITPLTAINRLRKRSISEKEPYTPFLFFENQESYFFVSVNTLFVNALTKQRANIRHYYVNALLTQGDKNTLTDPTIIIGQNAINDIISLSVLHKYDTMSKSRNNTFSTTSKYFDLTTKAFVRVPFTLSEKQRSFFLGNQNPTNTDSFRNKLEGVGIGGPYTITNIGRVAEGCSRDFYPEATSSINAYTDLLLQDRILVNLYGDNNFKAGDAINLAITNIDGKLDPTLAGNHLITRVKHMITFDTQPTYIISLECIKGSYITEIGSMKDVG